MNLGEGGLTTFCGGEGGLTTFCGGEGGLTTFCVKKGTEMIFSPWFAAKPTWLSWHPSYLPSLAPPPIACVFVLVIALLRL